MGDNQGVGRTEAGREGVVGCGLTVWVRGLDLVLMSGSASVVSTPTAGGGSGRGLVEGVSCSPSVDLSK